MSKDWKTAIIIWIIFIVGCSFLIFATDVFAYTVVPADPYFNLLERIAGDVNLDGELDYSDYAFVLTNISNSKNQTPCSFEDWKLFNLLDTDRNYKVDLDDVFYIKQDCMVYDYPAPKDKSDTSEYLMQYFNFPDMMNIV